MAEKAENGHTVVQSNETHSQAIELRISGDDATGSNPAVSASTSSQSNLIDDQQEEVEHQFFKCCQNSVAAHCCIDDWRSKSIEDPKTGEEIDTQLEIVLVPEAFRMWFYYGWWIFITTAIVVSIMFADIPYDDNPFIEYFNGLSICIFFDYAPFGYFGALLWMPQIINLCVYELLDIFRVYDCYNDGLKHKKDKDGNPKKTIGITFFRCYLASTIFEIIGFIGFIQTMATSPEENWRVHSVPYLIMTYGLWTMAFKRFLYLNATGKLDEALSVGHKHIQLKKITGWCYVILLWVAMFFKTSILWPNFFGAKLWMQSGWEWTDVILQYSVYVWFLLTLVVPIVIYWVITEDLDKVKFVINRQIGSSQI